MTKSLKEKKINFIESSISTTPIGDAFMFNETSSNVFGPDVYCSFEGTDIIQISNMTFFYKRYSSGSVHKAIERFKTQLLSSDDTWSAQDIIPKNAHSSDSSTQWTLVSLSFNVENYSIKLIYDQVDTAHAGMCFSVFTIKQSVYSMNDVAYFEKIFESIRDFENFFINVSN